MKNLYKWLFLFIGFVAFSQDLQNANWLFGSATNGQNYSLLNFNTIPTTVTNITPNFNGGAPLDFIEGKATVSDDNGNLLFVTDGVRVYRNTPSGFVLITNQLLGDTSSAQNVIIVPRPNMPSHYYLFTIVGGTSTIQRGMCYSEIDLGIGANGGIVPGTLNTFLQDDLGNSINASRNNNSEGITSALASDCENFWVVAHITGINNKNIGAVYSYKVTQTGVVNQNGQPNKPSSTTTFNNVTSNHVVYSIKISPNFNRIAMTTGLGLFTGSFNNANGAVNLSSTASYDTTNGVYGLEFSNNSNMLYYSRFFPSQIVTLDLSNNSINTLSTNLNIVGYAGLQRAIDGNIYGVAFFDDGVTRGLIKITNVDTLQISYDDMVNTVYTLGLPQWVWHQCCLPTLTLTSADNMTNGSTNAVTMRERSDWIKASNVIGIGNTTVGDGVVYHAGNYVEFNPGFEAVVGSQFSAYIEGCSGAYTYKQESGSSVISSENIDSQKFNNKISIYPNPTNSYFTVSYANEKFNHVIITSMEGRVILDQKITATNSYQLDISNYKAGIYTVSIQTNEGNTVTDKLIKN